MKYFLIVCFLLISAGPCGSWRWSVKIGSDLKGNYIDSVPIIFSYDSLRAHDVITFYKSNSPRQFDEFEFVKYRCRLIRYKTELDGDIHLFVSSPDNNNFSTVCEIPNPQKCIDVKNGLFSRLVSNCRDFIFSKKCFWVNGWYIFSKQDIFFVYGMLFHDARHAHCDGHMPNFLEIHPVFRIDSV